ncbi:MAG: flagellar hook-basal body complex protein FliE [Cohnella sp.]|nr:flagellar hook-basal body complex protein FliE [Cohnella sp.]
MISNNLITPVNLGSMNALNPAERKTTPAEATESFASFLKQAIDGVAAQEANVHKINDQFIIGQADVNDVMIAASKAELSLSLVTQVRNKVVEAYQEIMRMQV